jgi:hypothetical protein
MSSTIKRFLRKYRATAAANTPVQPNIEVDEDEDSNIVVRRDVECAESDWSARKIGTVGATLDEAPQRFIDGSHTGQPVLCVRSSQGYPIPLFLSEIGTVSLRQQGRGFVREHATVERVLSFVVDPFEWSEIENFSSDLMNSPEFALRVLCANLPKDKYNPFDYEMMRSQARNRAVYEMETLEQLAFNMDRSVPALIDGNIDRVAVTPKAMDSLVVGVVKTHSKNYLHTQGWQTLLELEEEERTPVFRISANDDTSGTKLPVATWFLKLTSSTQLAPNWGYVRVEVPWNQFEDRTKYGNFSFVDRLSRWLIQAKCTSNSYARMPVSLDPIVRAEDALKPLFTPTVVLVNRLYRTAGLFRVNEG